MILLIIQSDKKIFHDNVRLAVIPSKSGSIGIMDNHENCNLITESGYIKIYKNDINIQSDKVYITENAIVSFYDNTCRVAL